MAFREQDSCGSYELYSFIPLSIYLFMDFFKLKVTLYNPGLLDLAKEPRFTPKLMLFLP